MTQVTMDPADSSDSQESHNIASGTDVASTVFGFAPYWVYAQTWHCQHPSDSSSESSFIHFSEPQTAEEVLQLYRNRQMKGSNLVVGLSSGSIGSKSIPSSFCRTLAYVFEVAKVGNVYPPVSEEDVQRGKPVKGWCEPLWARTSDGGFSSDASEFAATSGDRGAEAEKPDIADPSASVFMSAPFWCYLYSHEPSRAKKTPPKTAEHMMHMFRSGCLPDWTPVLGLQLDVSTFNSLPPSLFTPLGALLHHASSGCACKAVGLAELTRWDKFIGSRTSNGCTQGVLQQSLSCRAGRSHAPVAASVPSSPTGLQNKLSGTAAGQLQGAHNQQGVPSYYPQQQSNGFYSAHPSAYMPYQMNPNAPIFQSPFGAAAGAVTGPPQPMMWGYSQFNGGGGAPGFMPGHPIPQSLGGFSPAAFGTARQQSLDSPISSSRPPLQVDRATWGYGQPRNSAGVGGARQSSGRRSMPSPASMGAMHMSNPPLMVPPQMSPNQLSALHISPGGQGSTGITREWETALFRLFTADATRRCSQSAWWYLTADGAKATGPVGCEQMILAYARGTLLDNHLVCGTTSDVPRHLVPTHDLFENVGSLLAQVEQGGQYVLVTLQEIVEASRAAGPMSANHSEGAAQNLALKPDSAKPGFWCSSSSGSNSHRGSKDGEATCLSLPMLMTETVDAAATVKAVPSNWSPGGGLMLGPSAGAEAKGVDASRDQKARPATCAVLTIKDRTQVDDKTSFRTGM